MSYEKKLQLTTASLAKVSELFLYKEKGFHLQEFPGYTNDQWGIKAHNRPWIEEVGNFSDGQKILEVGGAYSLLPKYLSEKYNLEAWVGDDFGASSNDPLWSRWGDPKEFAHKHPTVNYVFEQFGVFSQKFPDSHFDRIFTVSTLEHIPNEYRLNVFKDMHRCLKPGGRQIHTIDIHIKSIKKTLLTALGDKVSILRKIINKAHSEIISWIELIEESGVNVDIPIPNSLELLDRQILVESPDVVYRFYPPNNASKSYKPAASLLLIIDSKQ